MKLEYRFLAFVSGFSIFSSVTMAAQEIKEFPAKDISRLEFKNQSGEVKILGQDTNTIVIKIEKVKFDPKCEINFETSGRKLEIESGKESLFSQAECRVNFNITIPKNIDLELKSMSGNLEVNGTKGDLNLKIGSGDIKVHSIVEELNAVAGSGSIEVRGLVGNANVKNGSGDIKLTYAKDPGRGEIDIKTGSGDTTLFLPAKMRVHSKVLIGAGDSFNEIGDFEDAKFRVSFKAGSGNISIKAAEKATE